MLGQRCILPGMVKNTYGTGCFMLFNTGNEPVFSSNGLLTTVGYKLGPNAKATYALEGSVAIAGAAVKWLRDNMGIIKESSEISKDSLQLILFIKQMNWRAKWIRLATSFLFLPFLAFSRLTGGTMPAAV